jgi:hypothetical protein
MLVARHFWQQLGVEAIIDSLAKPRGLGKNWRIVLSPWLRIGCVSPAANLAWRAGWKPILC